MTNYFSEEDFNFNVHLDNPLIYTDPYFSASLDYMVAEIMANDRLKVYLKTEIDAISIKAITYVGIERGLYAIVFFIYV